MEKGLVSIIIVNRNGLRWLEGCFGSVSKQNYINYEIIFVDNASEDDSVSWVRKHYPGTKIIVNRKNLGFAQANNIGYYCANGTYILFLNNDTKGTSDFISELVKVFEDDSTIGGAQSKILLMDDPRRLDSIGAFLTPTGFLYHYRFGKKDEKKFDKQINLFTAKGACMMFRRDVLEEIKVEKNIFDPDFFAYYEETDLCHRVWLTGYRIVYAYRSVISHKVGATSSTMPRSFIFYHSFKNRIASLLKNCTLSSCVSIIIPHIVLLECYAVVAFLRGQWSITNSIQKAILWNMVHIKETLAKRLTIQHKIRKKSDEDIKTFIMRYPNWSYYMYMLRALPLSDYNDRQQ